MSQIQSKTKFSISDDSHSLWVSCISGVVDPGLFKKLKAILTAKDPWGGTAAVRASVWGRVEILSQLVAGGVKLVDDVDTDGNTLLHHAAAHGQASTCAYLLKQGLKVDKPNLNGETPLTLATNLPQTRFLRKETIEVLNPSAAVKAVAGNPGSLADLAGRVKGQSPTRSKSKAQL